MRIESLAIECSKQQSKRGKKNHAIQYTTVTMLVNGVMQQNDVLKSRYANEPVP